MITLTATAITHLKELLASQGAASNAGLRLHVEKGGCAGMQYTMRIDQSNASDQVYTQGGVSVLIDSESYRFLQGSTIDYQESLNDSGFKLENPNAVRSCGCGTSFEPPAGLKA